MEYTRTFVFKEIKTNNETYFQWFKLLDEPREKEYIEASELLSEWEHWGRLEWD
jgi:hypothetical protein